MWLYEVTAEFEDDTMARDWTRWMLEEHLADVVRAGALSGRLARIDESPHTFVAHYEFESKAALQKYLEEQSPRLRGEAARRFDPSRINYSRRTGEILGSAQPA